MLILSKNRATGCYLRHILFFVWIAEDTEKADFKMSSCQIMTSIWGLKPSLQRCESR